MKTKKKMTWVPYGTKKKPIMRWYVFSKYSTYDNLPPWVKKVTAPTPIPFNPPSIPSAPMVGFRLPFIVTLPVFEKPGSKATINHPIWAGDRLEKVGRRIVYKSSWDVDPSSIGYKLRTPPQPEPAKKPDGETLVRIETDRFEADRAADELWSVLRWFSGIKEGGRTMMTMPEMNVLDIALRAVHARVQHVATRIRAREIAYKSTNELAR